MLSPAIRRMQSAYYVDAVLIWTANCHPDARLDLPYVPQLRSFDLDRDDLLQIFQEGYLHSISDSDLTKTLLNLQRLRILDTAYKSLGVGQLYSNAELLVEEAYGRGLI